MIDEMIANVRCVNRSWSRVTTGLLRGQWAWVDASFRTAVAAGRARTRKEVL
jgi:hypothetical protein